MSDSTTTIGDLKSVVKQFVDERHWQQFHSLKADWDHIPPGPENLTIPLERDRKKNQIRPILASRKIWIRMCLAFIAIGNQFPEHRTDCAVRHCMIIVV